ncbi:MAG: hypothetical protein IT479_13845 [Xanthomonadales bacterium]|nr:Virginiamycin B lyase [Xanthomonadales bacterium]MCC6594342.1 hypothetical protein [Xanthomonadales bacterium]
MVLRRFRPAAWLACASAVFAGALHAQAPFIAAHPSARAGGDALWAHALDAQSNLYAAGYGNQAYLSKSDASGVLQWEVAFGDGATVPYGMALDGLGGIALVGGFSGSVDFDPGPGVVSLNASQGQVFVARYLEGGALDWVHQFRGSNNHAQAVAVDASGAVFATSGGGIQDFDPGPGVAELEVQGAWLVKLDIDGGYLWARTLATFPYALEVHRASGAIHWVGDLTGTTDLDPGPAVSLVSVNGGWDAFVVKLDGAGNFLWGRTVGSPGLDEGVGLAVSADGRVALSGYGGQPMDLDPGPGVDQHDGRGFLSVLDASGDYLFGLRVQPSRHGWWFDTAFDDAGNVYVGGFLNGSADVDPGPGTATFSSGSYNDTFVASYAPDGSYRWAALLGPTSDDEWVTNLAVNANRVVASTRLIGSLDVDPGAGIQMLSAVDGLDGLAWIFEAGAPAQGGVYVADFGAGELVRLSEDGATRAVLLSGLSNPTGLTYDGSNGQLYFTESTGNQIRRVNRDGSGLVTLLATNSRPYGIAVDAAAGKLYWSEDTAGQIWRANLDGSSPQLILAQPQVTGPTGLALDSVGGFLYWADFHGGFIGRSSLDGSSAQVLVSGRPVVNHVALDRADGRIYWSEGVGGGRLMSAHPDGSDITVVAAGLAAPTGIGIDTVDDELYVGHELGARVSKVRADGSGLQDAWASFVRPIGVAWVADGDDLPPVSPSVRLTDSSGQGIAGATVSYYQGGWLPFGTTAADGRVASALPPASYTFRIEYAGASVQKVQNTASNPQVEFQTRDVVVQLRDSAGQPLDTGIAHYYAGGWRAFGTTSGGEVRKELLPTSYTFRIEYAGTSVQKIQNVASQAQVLFQTVAASVRFSDSQGQPLDGGIARYYAGGWRSFGTTVAGVATRELLPVSYTFDIAWGGASVQKAQNVGSQPEVQFQTRRVVARLTDHLGQPLDIGGVHYYAGGWRVFGDTSAGEVARELLPAIYTFRMSYAGASVQKAQNVASQAEVGFQTGAVVSASGSCDGYYAGGWRTFSQGMQLLPGSYTFRFSSGSPTQESLAVSAGIENAIR